MKWAQKKKKGNQSNTYAVKNSIDDVFVSDYIRLIFDADLYVLVKHGKCPEKALIEAKNTILYEFTMASGGEKINPLLNSVRKITLIKNQITTLTICQNLIVSGEYDLPREYLKSLRIRFNEKDINTTLSLLNSRVKELTGRYNHEVKIYADKLPKDGENRFTRDDFERQVTFLSKQLGFRIDKNTTTLREYASYLSDAKREIKQQENGAGKPHTGPAGRTR